MREKTRLATDKSTAIKAGGWKLGAKIVVPVLAAIGAGITVAAVKTNIWSKIKISIANPIFKNKLSEYLSVSKDNILEGSASKYMDEQKEDCWCQLYAFQGMLNKNFKIKPKIRELYEIAFPSDKSYNEKNYMKDDFSREAFANSIIERYSLNATLKCTIESTKNLTVDKLIDEITKMYNECGPLCINSNVFGGNEHALLISELDLNHNTVIIETWGYSITFKLSEIAKEYLGGLQTTYQGYSCPFDQHLRIYGLKKNK